MVQSKVSPIESVKSALAYLAGQCDGAIQDDGVGFSGADSFMGKRLAGRETLSTYQAIKAAEMLQKYRKQLERGGIELPTVEEVQDALDRSAVPVDRTVVKKRSASSVVESVAVSVSDVKTEKPWLTSEWREGLSEQQQEAFDLAHEWFFSQPDSPLVLTGRPGTGKSYTAQRIVKSIAAIYGRNSRRPLRVALTAPTHRARAVLEKFAAEVELACCIETMHSLLYLKPGKADKDGKRKLEVNEFKFKKRDRDPYWSDFDLIVADEQSMVTEDLFKFMMQHKTPTILMGDPRQLPPVEDDKTEKSKLSPVFSLPCGVNLTKVMRYDGDIARYVDAIADTIDGVTEFLPRISKFETTNGNLIKISDPEKWEANMLEFFKSGEQCRAIAWTNDRVSKLNAKIREAVTGVSVEDQEFIVGDRVMAKEPIVSEFYDHEWNEWKQESLIQTCAEGKIVEIQNRLVDPVYQAYNFTRKYSKEELIAVCEAFDKEEIEVSEIPVKQLTVEVESGAVAVFNVVVGEAKRAIVLACEKLKHVAKTSKDEEVRKAHWRGYYHLCEAFSLTHAGSNYIQRLQFAFASTAHQSQGGTYEYVFADINNMMGCVKDPFLRNRLVYVAASRASEQLIALSKY